MTHCPNRDEILLVLTGELRVTWGEETFAVVAGDVVVVPSGSWFRVDGGATDACAWVTTTPGLEAITADGMRIIPPWAS